MKTNLKLALLSVATTVLGVTATIANAATLVVNTDGKLAGAKGVTVGTQTYDVEFKDGSCAEVYGTCAISAFAFTSESDARIASQALLDQVFINGVAGQFDSDPALTIGCSRPEACGTITPFGLESNLTRTIYAYNFSDGGTDRIATGNLSSGYSSTPNPNVNFAVFTPSAAVPEPASWAMMIGGFGIVGGSLRRRRRVSANVEFA